jgi:hypothetical protein
VSNYSDYLGPPGDRAGDTGLSGTAPLGRKGDTMKSEYDFSKGTRGKFYRADAVFRFPVYLDEAVQSCLVAKAESKGVDLFTLVNELLKKDIDIIETVK